MAYSHSSGEPSELRGERPRLTVGTHGPGANDTSADHGPAGSELMIAGGGRTGVERASPSGVFSFFLPLCQFIVLRQTLRYTTELHEV